ncbi:uncharacterized protein I303_106922 [Kwoniella dejecticola CBS 10117]|uniref:Uncharacterized protein n=1 Tax=Kwoniella dejecticola CBS 10117 TaxID=1296121 RepID=A0A1A5ZTB2_9TREE|nr:uncharacterized protein I303_08439 [Kwoniella dejecticola CBS 10117]OBR81057.1 hypothetical protein I303_08439 [Kwoniella dejecticola CBS 10117]
MSQQSTQIVTEGAIPTAASDLRLNLVGGQADDRTTGTRRIGTISSVPLRESRGLPLSEPENHDPPHWPRMRGMPSYIPYEANIDFSERPLGKNNVEFGFVVFMLSGVLMVGTINGMWRNTLGRFKDDIFQYKIGGHW